MALPSSGQIKLSEMAAEFGGAAASKPHSMSEYYKANAGPVVGAVGNGNVPTSGMIKCSNFHSGTKGGTQGGNKSSASGQIINSPTKTTTYTLDSPFNPYSTGNQITFSIGGTFQAGPYSGSYQNYTSAMNAQSRGFGLYVRVRFLYNGSAKATWGYTQLFSRTFNFSYNYSDSQSLSGTHTIACSEGVNQVEVSHYASPSVGSQGVQTGTAYCWHHETVTVNSYL